MCTEEIDEETKIYSAIKLGDRITRNEDLLGD